MKPAATAFACALLLVAAEAAAERPRLRVDVDPCVGVPAAAVRRDVGVELDALLVEARDAEALDTTRVTIGCDERLVRIVVEDPLSGKQVARRIDPARESTKGRARVLALAAVELVSASWLELRVKEPAATAVDVTASDAARRTAAESVARIAAEPAWAPVWRLSLIGGGRGFSSPFARTWGAQAAVQRDLRRALALEASAAVEGGSAAVTLGRVGALLASAAGALVVRTELAGWAAEAGVGGRFGLVRMTGTPAAGAPEAEGQSAVLPWGGTLLLARASVPLGRRVAVTAGVESGLVTLPAAGLVDDVPDLDLKGFWLTIGAGLVLALPGS